MNGLGLVFAGGGGKGAYQIGVWKLLCEYGIDQYVTGVSGTSVGALNAALFASGNYASAESLWKNISPEQILQPAAFSKEVFMQEKNDYGIRSAFKLAGHYAENQFMTALGNTFRQSSTFSREGLKALLDDGVDFANIRANTIPCFATCLDFPDFQLQRFDLRNYDKNDAETILLASSAIPFIFDAVEFQGKQYYDGGIPCVGDNIPIMPLYEQGAPTILVIHLGQDTVIDRDQFPGATIIEVIPQVDLGNFIDGTLDFTPEGAQWRIDQGYQDARRIFEPLLQQLMLSHKNHQIGLEFQKQTQVFTTEHNRLQKDFRNMMDHTKTDNLTDLMKQIEKGRN